MIYILKKKTSEKLGFKIENLGTCIQLSNTILEVNIRSVGEYNIRKSIER